MSDRRSLTSSLSACVVRYLVGKGHSQARIARMLGVSEGYVSLVKSRERSLTLDHIERLSEWLGVPLGALLQAVVPPPKNPSPEAAKFFKASAKLMDMLDRTAAAMPGGIPVGPAKRRPKPLAR